MSKSNYDKQIEQLKARLIKRQDYINSDIEDVLYEFDSKTGIDALCYSAYSIYDFEYKKLLSEIKFSDEGDYISTMTPSISVVELIEYVSSYINLMFTVLLYRADYNTLYNYSNAVYGLLCLLENKCLTINDWIKALMKESNKDCEPHFLKEKCRDYEKIIKYYESVYSTSIYYKLKKSGEISQDIKRILMYKIGLSIEEINELEKLNTEIPLIASREFMLSNLIEELKSGKKAFDKRRSKQNSGEIKYNPTNKLVRHKKRIEALNNIIIPYMIKFVISGLTILSEIKGNVYWSIDLIYNDIILQKIFSMYRDKNYIDEIEAYNSMRKSCFSRKTNIDFEFIYTLQLKFNWCLGDVIKVIISKYVNIDDKEIKNEIAKYIESKIIIAFLARTMDTINIIDLEKGYCEFTYKSLVSGRYKDLLLEKKPLIHIDEDIYSKLNNNHTLKKETVMKLEVDMLYFRVCNKIKDFTCKAEWKNVKKYNEDLVELQKLIINQEENENNLAMKYNMIEELERITNWKLVNSISEVVNRHYKLLSSSLRDEYENILLELTKLPLINTRQRMISEVEKKSEKVSLEGNKKWKEQFLKSFKDINKYIEVSQKYVMEYLLMMNKYQRDSFLQESADHFIGNEPNSMYSEDINKNIRLVKLIKRINNGV